METIRLTAAGAVVRYLAAQRIEIDGEAVPLFAGVFAIFGHGNVTCLGHELEQAQDALPTWRGQNEQGMALAACGFARAAKRRRIMVAASSIGPGATNMVTAAAVALANRLPLLLLAGDTFDHRIDDPVLQQVEHFGAPATTVNDAFRAVVRYWDRITAPEQVVQSLPHAINTMLDPGDCGPAFIALPQDVQAEAYDFPVRFFDETAHHIRRPRPDVGELRRAAAALSGAERPLIIAGGGVRWSLAEPELAAFADAHGIPVVETTAGRTSLPARHPLNCGPIGVTGCTSANAMAATALGGASDPHADLPTYAQVVGAVDRAADESTYVVAAAGGLPGELVNGWRAQTVHSFDCEYGYSCMGYEISGAWGAKLAMPEREVVVLLGDGSYLMMNSDLYSTVLTGHKLIVIVADNGGYAVFDRLQVNQGGESFNNLFADCRTERLVDVDFAAHAAAMGCETEAVQTIGELESAIERARAADRTYVIALKTHPHSWTGGGSFWEVGVPEVSASESVRQARADMDAARAAQRVGW